MNRLSRVVAVALLAVSAVAPAQSQQRAPEASAVATDPRLERRMQALAAELRCLVCQNQTIADSNAGLAVDLKNQIREQMRAGRTDRQIMDFMVERYGDFVLYRPPVKAVTALLWGGPFLLLAVGAGTAAIIVRRRSAQRSAAPQLTDKQRRTARGLLEEEPGKPT